MPHSLVLNLLPQSQIPKNHLSGRHLHALFLDLVCSVDAELASTLHQQQSEKAFTLSPLQVMSSRIAISSQERKELQFQHDRSILRILHTNDVSGDTV